MKDASSVVQYMAGWDVWTICGVLFVTGCCLTLALARKRLAATAAALLAAGLIATEFAHRLLRPSGWLVLAQFLLLGCAIAAILLDLRSDIGSRPNRLSN